MDKTEKNYVEAITRRFNANIHNGVTELLKEEVITPKTTVEELLAILKERM